MRELSRAAADTQRQVDQVFREVIAEGGPEAFRSDKPFSTRSCVIAMLPRTGSTALSSLMAATGVLGDPDEFFNPRGPIPMWLRQYPAPTMREYAHTLRRERASPNGVFSVKTTFLDLAPTLEAGLVTDFLGRTDFIYLTRRDLIAQAISAYLAEGSGVWHRDQAGDIYRPTGSESPAPPFDERRILQKLDDLVAMHEQWERTFALYSIDPLRLTYEEFVADASATVRRIASYLGVEWSGTVSLDSAVTAKLGNERSARWAALIRANHRL